MKRLTEEENYYKTKCDELRKRMISMSKKYVNMREANRYLKKQIRELRLRIIKGKK